MIGGVNGALSVNNGARDELNYAGVASASVVPVLRGIAIVDRNIRLTDYDSHLILSVPIVDVVSNLIPKRSAPK